MKLLLAIFSVLLLSFQTSVLGQTTIEGTIDFDDLTREYTLYLPADLPTQAPLVFNLHGYTSNGFEQRIYSAMDDVADASSFAVCYPEGTIDDNGQAFWNSGFGEEIDDTGFLIALAQALQSEHDLDPDRTFSCGMSNGGFMSYHLACQASDTFKAVASVTGTMSTLTLLGCDPSLAVPIFEIHGTNDLVVPYDGAEFMTPIDEVVDFWANSNGCGAPDEYELEDINLADFSNVTVNKYTNCTSGNEVWLYTVNGGSHTWPGAFPIGGVTNQDFEASVEIWNFFAQCQPTVGVSELESERQKVYPNPAHDMLCGLNGAYELWSLSGSRVVAGITSEQCFVLPNLSPGLYIVKSGVDFSEVERLIVR